MPQYKAKLRQVIGVTNSKKINFNKFPNFFNYRLHAGLYTDYPVLCK
jgi:hypothetical protein